MARIGRPIHGYLVERLDLDHARSLCDLGCGAGGTLVAAAAAAPELELAGIDRSARAIAVARSNVAEASADLLVGDLTQQLPWASGAFDRLVCHNVLECLTDPATLIEEAIRVLASGGVAVWSHTDFSGFMVAADDHSRCQAVLDAYGETVQSWMDHANGRMGRELPGLLMASGLDVAAVEIHNTIATDYASAEARVLEIDSVLRTTQTGAVPSATVDAWRADLEARGREGRFFLAEPTVVTTTHKPA